MRSPTSSRHSKLLKIFPLPQFVDVPAAGIDISDYSIKFIELARTRHGFRVGKFGEEKIPPNVVESGKISNPEELVRILRGVKDKHNLSFIRASLPEEEGFLFESQVPHGIKQSEAQSVLELRLSENVPLSPTESVFDYEVIGIKGQQKDGVDVVVTVYPRTEIEKYLDIFHGAGLTPLSLEIEAQAIARAVIKEDDLGTYMIVDFGKRRSGISVVSGGAIRFTTTIDVGGDSITETLKKQYPNATDKELDDVKNEKGIRKGRESDEVITALMDVITHLRDEINKHYIYWHTHSGEGKKVKPKIEKIILCGGNSNVAGIPEFLSRSLKLPVERANVWGNVFSVDDYVPPISFRESLTYASAIGLALHSDTERIIPA